MTCPGEGGALRGRTGTHLSRASSCVATVSLPVKGRLCDGSSGGRQGEGRRKTGGQRRQDVG